MPDDSVWIRRARELATSVFAPAAMAVEASQRVPPEHLDLLAAEGFYGLAGPREAGGLDVPFPVACRIIEILAGACLSTTFVWMQHHGVVRAVAGRAPPRCGRRCSGRCAAVSGGPGWPWPACCRGRPGCAPAPRLDGGYVLDGASPWVTGWGLHRHAARGRPAGGRHGRLGRSLHTESARAPGPAHRRTSLTAEPLPWWR